MSELNNNTVFQPGGAIYLELWMIGVIVSAIVYGGVLSLSLSYVPLLLKTSNDISRRMRNFLLVYVTIMVAFSTVYIITISIDLSRSIVGYPNHLGGTVYWFQNGLVGAMCTTFASWGADGFMLWRCAVLYEGISRQRRIALIAVLILLGLMSFISGLIFLSLRISGIIFFLTIIGVTIILNFVTSTLITLRILYFHRYIRKNVGLDRNSPYITILLICVESAALIIVFSLIFFILVFQQANGSYIPMQLLVHVYVISPLLIVYRVAQGKVAAIGRRPKESGPVVSSLHFQSQVISSSSNVV